MLQNATMTEIEYERERAKLRELYGDSRSEAGVRFEQALATLFYRSGWTQEKLAAKEGKRKSWISQRVIFGRFLNFSTVVEKSENLPNNLSEGRFRSYWEQTKGDERERFKAIHRMMLDEIKLIKDRRPQIGPDIKKKFADGKWHSVQEIADDLDADPEHVADTLDGMAKNQTYNCKTERKRGPSKEPQFRIFNMEKAISLGELIEKLKPIVDGLRAEGRKNMATMSPNQVAYLAGKLQKLLDEWAE